eukprot:TRINITY_DN9611_c0_g2_i2.p6 TRINITY_DN9611_c0_g2~~TRINITY_DN9611_c0_g2_i2.p6  ORF type:complete len:104 (-),score=10.18 TRINITY_DN9611_c0_g2_i2:1116-1427(-)
MSSGQTLGVKAQRFRGHTSPHRNVIREKCSMQGAHYVICSNSSNSQGVRCQFLRSKGGQGSCCKAFLQYGTRKIENFVNRAQESIIFTILYNYLQESATKLYN